ncbi:hypothetical protein [Persephonella sp.]|uniref:hypothetical protein n=2 Tax=Persephonella sp. TaxID=2060922 RepID=UPI0026003961|nr:hypothetical protein [Persephonella sp.]
MSKNIKVDLEVVITSDSLYTTDLILDKEIILEDYNVFVTVNRAPFYKAKIKKEDNLLLCKITSILEPEESVKIKEKYLI